MRTMAIAAALALGALAAAPAGAAPRRHAAPAPAAAAPQGPPTAPPRYLEAAGYGQPDITPAMCESLGPKEARCTVPAMTAGRYLIIAAGASTASGAGAAQGIEIRLNDGGGETLCARGASGTPKGAKPWISGARTIRIACVAQFVSDRPLLVRALYGDAHATASPKGPGLFFRKLPWSPIMSTTQVSITATPQPAAK
ncbi:MAG TPA: hypothetical protein VMU93_11750 [Caulobacteraceae bacterium]|nr:hypothetical protein [Caulobacteraceae bacterium]